MDFPQTNFRQEINISQKPFNQQTNMIYFCICTTYMYKSLQKPKDNKQTDYITSSELEIVGPLLDKQGNLQPTSNQSARLMNVCRR